MKNILILGATGRTGTLVLKKTLSEGYSVTALVRNPEKIPFHHPNLRVIKGDVLIKSDVQKAVQNIDAIISTLGRDGKKIEVITEGTKNILDVSRQSSVKHIICMSSMGSGSSAKGFGLLLRLSIAVMGLRRSFVAKGEQEQMFYQSDIPFTLLHPGSLKNDPEADISKLRIQDSNKIKRNYLGGPGAINRAQVASFIIDELENRSWVGRTVCLEQ